MQLYHHPTDSVVHPVNAFCSCCTLSDIPTGQLTTNAVSSKLPVQVHSAGFTSSGEHYLLSGCAFTAKYGDVGFPAVAIDVHCHLSFIDFAGDTWGITCHPSGDWNDGTVEGLVCNFEAVLFLVLGPTPETVVCPERSKPLPKLGTCCKNCRRQNRKVRAICSETHQAKERKLVIALAEAPV